MEAAVARPTTSARRGTQTTPAPRVAAKDRALDYVKTRVLTGQIAGGELISEGEVATALGMSRTPVREAFLRLEAEGLLRLYPKRGALVVPVSPEEVRAVMEARLVLERFAAEKVIRRGPSARRTAYERLSAELKRQRRAASAADFAAFLDSDRLFHSVTVEDAGNSIITGFYTSLRDRQMRMIGESAIREPKRTNTIIAEHRDIAEAVREGDVAQALKAVKIHHASTLRALGVAADDSLPWQDD
jgi:DNA-binding GntR family transcriptional regulator